MISPARKELSKRILPRRREGVQCHPIDDEAVLYDVAHDAVHYLNATARFIWQRCDGRHSVIEIGDAMGRAFDRDDSKTATNGHDAIIADVRMTLEDLSENGLLDQPARWIP